MQNYLSIYKHFNGIYYQQNALYLCYICHLMYTIYQPHSLNALHLPPQLELLVKFAAYVPELTMCSIDAVYFYGANLVFKQSATKLASVTRIFSHIKVRVRLLGDLLPGNF